MIVHQIPKPVICHFIERLTMGGAETLVWRLARGQRESKYEPIVCSLEGGPIQGKLERDGIRVFNLGMPRPPVSRPGRFVARLTSILSALRRTIHGTGTVLVHAHLQDAILLAEDASVGDAHAVYREHGYSRMAVYRETVDNITGTLVAKDLLPFISRGEMDHKIRGLVRPAHFVPVTMTVQQFVRDAQRHRTHLAIVVDEYGGTAGIVTLEDAMEQVVRRMHSDRIDAVVVPVRAP